MDSSSGATVWLTGLPSAGKTTVATALRDRLQADGIAVEVLDGDAVRPVLSPELGYSRADRDANVARIGWVASVLARHGVIAIAAVVSPFAAARDGVRALHDRDGSRFFEVHIATPVEVCAERDVKGLYARQRSGTVAGLTGVDGEYEPPLHAELVIDTSARSLDDSVAELVALLAEREHPQTVTGYPLLLDLSGRRVVVVGAGAVATRRVPDLIASGADILVVAPVVSPELTALAGSIRIERRRVDSDDLDGAWLVLVASDDAEVNAAMGAAAARRAIFCVRADEAPAGTARTPAVLRSGPVTVAVNAGDDPGRAAALRNAIGLALDTGVITTRSRRPAARGSVALVGGGPGDPGLITVRGRALLAGADVVVTDRLAPRALLAGLPDDVEIVDCGKAAHRHNLTQDQINAVLIDRARQGKRVVRLKGGDPYVFGRGAEEVEACVAAGVDVEVVPGVSSALAGPALAGIPLTHRGLAQDFTVISGHLDPGLPRDGGLPWSSLANGPDTLVLLMAMDRLGDIADTLISHGRAADTPVAVVHRASTPSQRVVRASLGEIGRAAVAAGVGAPSVVVIGAVADLGR